MANSAGPVFALELPIFDHQQAALAAAAFEEQRSLHRVEALEAQTRREVADAIAEAASLRRANDIRRAEASPALLRAVDTTRPGPGSDLDQYLGWLRSQTEAIEAQRKQLEVEAELQRAQRRLQRVLFVGARDAS